MNAEKVIELLTKDRLSELLSIAEKDIRETEIKKKSGAKEVSRLKKAEKIIKGSRFDCAWKESYEGIEYQCFTDSFIGFMLKNKLNIETKDIPETQSFRLFDTIKKDYKSFNQYTVDRSEVVAYQKINKSKYCGKPGTFIKSTSNVCKIADSFVSMTLLLNVIDILGGKITFFVSNNKYDIIVCESENGIAVLCPKRITKEKNEKGDLFLQVANELKEEVTYSENKPEESEEEWRYTIQNENSFTAESENNCIYYDFNRCENKYYAISNGEIREISKNTYQIALEQAKLQCQCVTY